MATVLFGGEDVMNEVRYGRASVQLLDRLTDLSDSASRYLNDVGRSFMERTASFRKRRDVREVRRMADAVKARISTFWQEDDFRHLYTRHELQNAPPRMHRYIMAEPSIRRRFLQGDLDAFDGRYIEEEPDTLDHKKTIAYQVVTDGLWEEEEAAYIERPYARFEDEDEYLTFQQRLTVLNAWNLAREAIADGYDPTSKWDASL